MFDNNSVSPKILPRYFSISLQVVIEDIDADSQITSIVGVYSVPTLRAELTAFTDNSVEVAKRKQNTFELRLTSTHFQRILK
jgi:hypothetical protein